MANFKKGSAAAKAYMAKLRAAKGKKKASPVGKAKAKSKTLFKRKLAVYARPNSKGKPKPYVRKVSGVKLSVADKKLIAKANLLSYYERMDNDEPEIKNVSAAKKVIAYYKSIDSKRKKVGEVALTKKGKRAKRLNKGQKEYNEMAAKYKYFIVKDGNVESGWEYKSDATDALSDYPKRSAFIYTLRQLKEKGINDPRETWMYKIKTQSATTKKMVITGARSKAQSRATKTRPHYKEFLKWLNSDNVIKMADGYTTQDAQYRNRLKTKEDAFAYFKKEFIGMSSKHKDTRSHNVNIKVVSGMYKMPKERIFIASTIATKKKLSGIGKTKDMIQYNVPQIKVLVQKRSIELMQKITSTKIAADMCRESINKTGLLQTQEVFGVLILNNQLQVLGVYNHTIGTQNSTLIDKGLVCAMIAKLAPKNAIIFHNHPSGATKPSEADRILTRDLKASFDLFGCQLVDSIIITQYDYYSFLDEGII